jgi:hypothetical protein
MYTGEHFMKRKVYLYNDSKMLNTHSADIQTLQQFVQNVWRPPSSTLPPCPLTSYRHRNRNHEARTPEEGLRPLPTNAHHTYCRRVQGPDSLSALGLRLFAHKTNNRFRTSCMFHVILLLSGLQKLCHIGNY